MSDVAEMRRTFDQAFAAPPRQRVEQHEELLAIRVAGDPYAVSVREIAGIAKAVKIVPLPSRCPELLGLAGIRGVPVPIYGTAALLGYGAGGETPRWLVMCGAEQPVGLAFSDFEAYLRVLPSDLCAAGRTQRQHVERVVRDEATVRSVISIPSMLRHIRKEG